ncbi:pyridoxamine 5'-phosphate oxidase [Methylobacillus sp. MM3]|uniref:pyridoxamine 5'-phosphate oxidase family protein n=1 Tax=Methylobacillus sp. MM3 TaxID=1848039 RepID=UPI0007E21C4D|nr:pyridoxamine 5'-phosphate oxidase family protein [Methylobacillus sp. MM3]OAJ72110.1 pyridoxamine 5'-phosphate oxidase [Methylobacillus sp. MM3]
MSNLYGEQHRAFQEAFDTKKMADRVSDMIVVPEIADEHRGFIESRDFFFLTTIDHRGYPTCSHKGGSPGFVKVVDSRTLAFPSFDGNGMYLSMGNINANPKIGMLFIDFETPHRVRVHGDAIVSRDDPLLKEFHGAELVVRVTIAEIFINCPRYIHRYQRVASSHYVPQPECTTPLPQWKRIDAIQDALPERDKAIADKLGGVITPEEYGALVMKGEA